MVPRRRRIAYFAGEAPHPQETLEIWVISSRGGEPQPLTEGLDAISGDGFGRSPDSNAVVFAAGPDNELWTASVPGGERRRITDTGGRGTGWKGLPSWSPAGGRVAYFTMAGTDRPRLRVVDLVGGRPKKVTDALRYHYAWAPDASAVAFGTGEGIAVAPVGGGEGHRVTRDGGASPLWSPDGATLFYVDGAGNLRSVPAAGGASRRLTTGGGVSGLSLSPDGRWIAFDRRVSDPNLWVVELSP